MANRGDDWYAARKRKRDRTKLICKWFRWIYWLFPGKTKMNDRHYKLVKDICDGLGLKRVVNLFIEFGFEGMPRVTAEIIPEQNNPGLEMLRREIKKGTLKFVEDEKESSTEHTIHAVQGVRQFAEDDEDCLDEGSPADPHKLPEGPAWLIRLRNAKGSVGMSDFAAHQIAEYVDNIRQAAWPVVRALEDAGDQVNWELGDETDRVYPWYEVEPLKKAVLGSR